MRAHQIMAKPPPFIPMCLSAIFSRQQAVVCLSWQKFRVQ